MKSKVLLTLGLLVFLSCASSAEEEEKFCTKQGRKYAIGEIEYSHESLNGIKACAVKECIGDPFPDVDEYEVQCSDVDHNCSLLSTPHARNLSICCDYCTECNFTACPQNSMCVLMNGASCVCYKGYEEVMVNGQLSCEDINECAMNLHDCPTNSDCVNVPGDHNCSCHPGYGGENCIDIDECAQNPDLCPTGSQCTNLDGFYECVCAQECLLEINSYYLTTPSEPEDFLALNQDCSYLDTFPDQNTVACTGQQQVLTDHSTTTSIPPAPDQYIGWDGSQGGLDSFVLDIDADHIRLTRLDVHFYHNPSAGIGLPEVSSVHVYSSKVNKTDAAPMSFIFASNEDVTQSDNGIRMVSIIITDPDSILFYQFVRVTFEYSSSLIWKTQLTEIQAYGGTDFITPTKKITFQSGSNQEVHMSADDVVSKIDLSCTVANPGRFSWQWTRASDGAVLSSGMNLADLTRTSVLTIDMLSMEASGIYVCKASHSGLSLALEGSATINLELASKVIKNVPVETVNRSDTTFSCEFVGYYPLGGDTVKWDFEGDAIQEGGKYAISHDQGIEGRSQRGKDSPNPSLISYLTIYSASERDQGIYSCRIIGDSCHQVIGYIQVGSAGTSSALVAAPPEACSTDTVDDTISTWFFLFVVELGIIMVMFLVIVIFICFLYCKRCRGNAYTGDREKAGNLSPDCKETSKDGKYIESPLYDVITAPAEYEVFHSTARYEVVKSPGNTDKDSTNKKNKESAE